MVCDEDLSRLECDQTSTIAQEHNIPSSIAAELNKHLLRANGIDDPKRNGGKTMNSNPQQSPLAKMERVFEIPLNDRDEGQAASFSNGAMTTKGQGRQRGRRPSGPSSYRRMSSSSSLASSQSRKRSKEGVAHAPYTLDGNAKPPMPETPKKEAIRFKRKSDELGGVDLSKILREHEQEMDPESAEFTPSVASSNRSSVFLSKKSPPVEQEEARSALNSDRNPASQTSIFSSTGGDPDQSSPTRSIFDDMAFVAETFQCDFSGITGRSVSASTSSSSSTPPSPSDPPRVLETPKSHETFRARQKEPSSKAYYQSGFQPYNLYQGDSPCTVTGLFNNGCGSFWERSLAWSEDEEDESDDSDNHTRRSAFYNAGTHKHKDDPTNSIVRERLSVPKQLGKDYRNGLYEETRGETNTAAATLAPTVSVSVATSNSIPRRSSSSSLNGSYNRVKTLETDSRHRRGSKMFRRTDIDNVTEIHWEEKLVDLDSSALDLMSKLSLS
jgi:hypothetical protein